MGVGRALVGAPVTRVLLLTCTALSAVLRSGSSNGWDTVGLDASKVLFRAQVWRLFTSQLVWTGMGEMLLGSILLVSLAVVEGQVRMVLWGSHVHNARIFVNNLPRSSFQFTFSKLDGIKQVCCICIDNKRVLRNSAPRSKPVHARVPDYNGSHPLNI